MDLIKPRDPLPRHHPPSLERPASVFTQPNPVESWPKNIYAVYYSQIGAAGRSWEAVMLTLSHNIYYILRSLRGGASICAT
ncbi:protein of unknown function [Burkholderia multivorans]